MEFNKGQYHPYQTRLTKAKTLNESNATESVQSDHPVHGHTLPVVSAIGQRPHPRLSAAVQPMSQQAAAEK